MSPANEALIFLTQAIFDLLTMLVILRFLLPFSGLTVQNPMVGFIIRLSNPFIIPLRRLIPPIRRIDSAALLVIFMLALAKVAAFSAILSAKLAPLPTLALWGAGELCRVWLMLYFYLVLAHVLLSWAANAGPARSFIWGFIAPWFRPIQRWMPNLGGIDLSPIPVMLLIQVLVILIANPLTQAGLGA